MRGELHGANAAESSEQVVRLNASDVQVNGAFCEVETAGGATVITTIDTVTVNDAVAMFPGRSLAEQVTVVVPSGNNEPDSGTHDTGRGPSTASMAVGSL